MEEFFTNAMNSGNATAIIAAAVVYLIITIQRGSTKKDRDDTTDKFDKRISLLEADSKIIHSQIDNIGDKLDKITDLLTLIQIELAKKQDKD